MSDNAFDCSMLEERIQSQNLAISSTQDQFDKLDPQDPDIQNMRDALTRKLTNLHQQMDMLQHALEDCRQGKGNDFPTFDTVPADEVV